MRALLLVALLLLARPALAHAAFDQGAPLPGGASVQVEVTGAPLVAAGVPLEARVATDAAGPVRLRLHPPMAAPRAWVDASAPVGFVLDGGGAWRLEVEAGGGSAAFDLDAWPAAGAFVEPASEAARRGVVVQGRPETVATRLVDAAGRPLDAPPDAVARVRGPAGEAFDAPLAMEASAWGAGAWSVEVLAPSLGLAPGARPPLGILVVPPEEAGVYGLEAKAVPLGLAPLAALVLAALTRGRPWRRSCSR
ncbi:MAG TPA: hypothetical protein VNX21_07075 [Candidatus Thermoplasmatota archaeon]|nr:hypothetical protein [Candidatus Thermoplasmatota archaeon]